MRERVERFCYTKKDFVLNWYSGSGAGGQHRNKHMNCLRLTHIPSGITVQAADARDRVTNQRVAFERLKPKLLKWIREQLDDKLPPRVEETVRTYHFADNRITDHASGLKMAASELDKRFGDLVDARLNALVAQRSRQEV